MVTKEHVDISKVQRQLDRYVARAHAGQRFVIRRYGRELAALVSYKDLCRVSNSRATEAKGGDHPRENVRISLMRTDFGRYVCEAADGKRYWITSARNLSWAGLVGMIDLYLLEAGDPLEEERIRAEAAERDERFRRALEKAGIEVSWPTGEPVRDRVLLKYDPGDELISEQIIRERR